MESIAEKIMEMSDKPGHRSYIDEYRILCRYYEYALEEMRKRVIACTGTDCQLDCAKLTSNNTDHGERT